MQRCGQTRQPEAEAAAGEVDFERKAPESLLRSGTDFAHQAQGFAIGTNQDMLAVIEPVSLCFHAARSSSKLSGGFDKRYLSTGRTQFDGGGQSGPAAADDRDSEQALHV